MLWVALRIASGGSETLKVLAAGSAGRIDGLHPGKPGRNVSFRLHVVCRLSPVVCRDFFSGEKRRSADCQLLIRRGEGREKRTTTDQEGIDRSLNMWFVFLHMSFVPSSSRLSPPVRQAKHLSIQPSPAQLFSASLIISTMHMRQRVRVLGLGDMGGIWGEEGQGGFVLPSPCPAARPQCDPYPSFSPPLRPSPKSPLPIVCLSVSVGCAGR